MHLYYAKSQPLTFKAHVLVRPDSGYFGDLGWTLFWHLFRTTVISCQRELRLALTDTCTASLAVDWTA